MLAERLDETIRTKSTITWNDMIGLQKTPLIFFVIFSRKIFIINYVLQPGLQSSQQAQKGASLLGLHRFIRTDTEINRLAL